MFQGCDKQFYNSSIQFNNMDPLMKYINQNSKEFGVTVRYATLGEYFQAIYQSNLIWEPRGSPDFLPYSTGEDVHLKHNMRCYLLYMRGRKSDLVCFLLDLLPQSHTRRGQGFTPPEMF